MRIPLSRRNFVKTHRALGIVQQMAGLNEWI